MKDNSLGKLIHERRMSLGLTLEQVGNAVGVEKSTVKKWEDGFISNMRRDKISALARCLKLHPMVFIDDDDEWSEKETGSVKLVTPNASETVYDLFDVPLYESASAGFGKDAIDSIVGYVPLPLRSQSEAEEMICIKVSGDSMSPKIEDGDIVQVRRQSSVDSGDIAVVLVNKEEGYIKKVEYNVGTKPDYINLISLNREYPTMTFVGPEVQRVEVVGKVKRILRDL